MVELIGLMNTSKSVNSGSMLPMLGGFSFNNNAEQVAEGTMRQFLNKALTEEHPESFLVQVLAEAMRKSTLFFEKVAWFYMRCPSRR
jgi:hypothetical protein